MQLTQLDAEKLALTIPEFNEFRTPDLAYIFGDNLDSLKTLTALDVASNYWIGNKEEVLSFANDLVDYFSNQYSNNTQDFQGYVGVWFINEEQAMVGNINLSQELGFWRFVSGLDPLLKKKIGNSLMLIMFDDETNYATELINNEIDLSLVIKKQIYESLLCDSKKLNTSEYFKRQKKLK